MANPPLEPDDASQPVSLTVHSPPSLDAIERRTVGGRWKMALILLACAAPVIASYFTYYVIRPEGRTNYGTLIQPTRTLPSTLALTTLEGQPVAPAALRGQWLLVAVGPGGCDAACEQRLYFQRQVREMLGRESERVDKVWLVTDAAAVSPVLRAALTQGDPTTMLRADRTALAGWLQAEPGQPIEAALYLVDPMGEWMMRWPREPEPARVKRDLERLLRASSSWDRAGR
jgi:hypothetical protein